jgi:hypothetical protein
LYIGNILKGAERKRWNVWSVFTLNSVKAIALEAWTGPEGSRRLRLPDFKTIGT